MSSKAKPIPDGFHGATPYLCCRNAAGAIDFYQRAFGATEIMRLAEPSGRIGHAEIKIGAAVVMLSDEYEEMGVRSPQGLGGSPVGIHLYVPDVDAMAAQAVAAGAKLDRPVSDQFYGDRSAVLTDPFGHRWFLATHIEDVAPEELQKRYDKMMKG